MGIAVEKVPCCIFYTVMDAINLSSALATEWLTNYMFSNEPAHDVKKKVARIVKKLNANNKSHSRHFTYDFCQTLGLNVESLEEDQ